MHKGYTLNYFINLVDGVTNTQIKNNGVANIVSPRLGNNSQAFSALNSFLDGNLTSIVNGTRSFKNFGATPRARLLKALRNRKKYGSVIV